MPETTSAPVAEPEPEPAPAEAPALVPDGATLPAGTIAGLENAKMAEPDPQWEKRRALRDELEDLAADVLKRALRGELPDSPHTRQQVDAALAIVRRY